MVLSIEYGSWEGMALLYRGLMVAVSIWMFLRAKLSSLGSGPTQAFSHLILLPFFMASMVISSIRALFTRLLYLSHSLQIFIDA